MFGRVAFDRPLYTDTENRPRMFLSQKSHNLHQDNGVLCKLYSGVLEADFGPILVVFYD